MMVKFKYVMSLSDQRANLETVGGKGASLARLLNAGLPVPIGFHITTEAYRRFVAVNDLQAKILAVIDTVDIANPELIDTASREIVEFFEQSHVPAEICDAISESYQALGNNHMVVAVRSSATAEDLPEASFAGQQETFLNIHGVNEVLDAVKKCWASLWTGRAISYRMKNGVDHASVALAVVVQELILAEASGVMFSANPINGDRNEVVINAAWGLGESIVGGVVTPDMIIVDKKKGKVIRRETADKSVMTIRSDQGTQEVPVPDSRRKKEVLSNSQARDLARYSTQIESLYGLPMDIEWTLVKGRFAIVQARPITSLPPEWKPPKPKVLYARGSFAEFIPDPVSPLFATLGIPIAQEATVSMMNEFLDINIPDNYQFEVVNGYIYVGIPTRGDVMLPFVMATLTQSKKMLSTATQRWRMIREKNRDLASYLRTQDLNKLTAVQLIDEVRKIFRVTVDYYTVAQSGTLPNASISEVAFCRFYKTLVKRKEDPEGVALLLGLDNQALRAEKALFDISMWLRGQNELADVVAQELAEKILELLDTPPNNVLWNEFQSRFEAYLTEYGHAIFDMDFASPLALDQPAPLVDAIKAYLAGTASSPYERQRQADMLREKTVAEMTRRLDPFRRKWFLKLFKWAVEAAPLREDSIADLGLGYPQIRRLLGELGCRLVEKGVIGSAVDVYWLEAGELENLALKLDEGVVMENYSSQVDSRKTQWQIMRRIIPPATLPKNSWMARFLPHSDQHGDTIKGLGSSAGKVTAPACVMLGPEDFHKMKPGCAVVAVTTTPAWTPLFALASAIVTDIGGPLSHSSIVAREYGIPAVLATGVATHRIQDGQIITVDGSAGVVSISNGGV